MTPLSVEDSYPLSPLQQGMLSQSLYAPRSGVEIFQLVAVLREALDAAAFQAAWQWSVDRHPMLRTAFRWDGLDRPEQIVCNGVPLPWESQDWRELSADEQEIRFAKYLREDRRRGVQLARPPLLRVALFRCGEEEYRFLLTFHHGILDGRSAPLLMRESFDCYEALCQGRAPQLPPPSPFRAYIERLEQQDPGAAEAFWRRAVAGFSAPTPLPGKPTPRAAMGDTGHAEIDARLAPEVTRALVELGEREGFTLNTALQGAWALVLSRWSGEEDVLFAAVKRCRSGTPGSETIVGPLINTLPVRVRVAPEAGLMPWLRELRAAWLALRDHEQTPLSAVQGWSELPAGQPLCESLLVFERYYWLDAMRSWGPAWENRWFSLRRQPDFPLTVYGFEEAGLLLKIIFDRQRFAPDFILRLLGYLRSALEAMAAPRLRGGQVGDVEVIPAAERWQVLGEWNDTGSLAVRPECLHEAVARQAALTPERIALVADQGEMTYAELLDRSGRLAHHLRRLGVGPERRVGVFLERGADLVVALLGVLHAGGAYVPLDPAYPAERVAGMLADSEAGALVTREALASRLQSAGCPIVRVDADREAIDAQPANPPQTGVLPCNLAYLMYTSGSTGRPKAVAVNHRNVVALLEWGKGAFSPADLAGVLASTSVCFDMSIIEIFMPLATGGRVILAASILDLPKIARAPEVTLISTVPSVMVELLRHQALPAEVRTINLGGELLSRDLVDELLEQRPEARVLDFYGPSEDTTYSTWAARERGGAVTIGRPLAGTRVYLLDDRLRPVPLGAAGELYLAGAGLTRGYLGRPERTAERFLPDPFGEPGARLYRTGDLARYLPGGSLELLGRRDRQTKIRGHRIEPGEVEAALRRHPAVAEAAVLVREDVPGERRLVAYVVPRAGALPRAADLLAHLKGRLPHYMVPAAVVPLELLPRMPNGKLDTRALPQPSQRRGETEAAAYVAPGTALEKTIARIWQEVLRVERIGLNDNFFDLGGHSLSIARVFQLLSAALGRDLSQVELFEYPTVSSLARRLARNQGEELEVAPIQQRAEAQRAARERRRSRAEALHE